MTRPSTWHDMKRRLERARGHIDKMRSQLVTVAEEYSVDHIDVSLMLMQAVELSQLQEQAIDRAIEYLSSR